MVLSAVGPSKVQTLKVLTPLSVASGVRLRFRSLGIPQVFVFLDLRLQIPVLLLSPERDLTSLSRLSLSFKKKKRDKTGRPKGPRCVYIPTRRIESSDLKSVRETLVECLCEFSLCTGRWSGGVRSVRLSRIIGGVVNREPESGQTPNPGFPV